MREHTDVADYHPFMEHISSDVMDAVLDAVDKVDFSVFTEADVLNALSKDRLEPTDFAALLSPAALPYLERIAERAREETRKHFGNSVMMFTPIYTSNYCENRCAYCTFNAGNRIHRARLTPEEVDAEMARIASTGLTEILILTGESHVQSDLEYIGMCVETATKHFSSIGIEVYPLNSSDYHYLREKGADYVTIFQETYDPVRYGELHLGGPKRVFSYRFNGQERALMGGMRGVAFGALLGLRKDWRKDAFACGMHAYLLQRKYPWGEFALSLPRLRPSIIKEEDDNPVHERDVLQVAMAYRLMMPFAGITISTREVPSFRDGIVRICATKISADSHVGIGGRAEEEKGDGQFEVSDSRSVEEVRKALEDNGMQPVFNDYVRT